MTEDERTVERASDVDSGSDAHSGSDVDPSPGSDAVETDDVAVGDATDDLGTDALAADDAAASFLELEADLDETDPSAPSHADGDRVRALVTGAERTDAATVPDGYPLDRETDEVLALTLDLGGRETTAYLDWPEGDEASPLRRLLDAMDVELGDLYGRRLLVERTGSDYAVVTPSERPRSAGGWGLGVLGGLALAAGCTGLLAVTGGASVPLGLLWVALTVGWLPYATYRDAWYLRTHSDWGGGPLFWAALSALPVANLFVGLAYLWRRRRATFLGDEPSLSTRLARGIRSLL